MKPIQEIFETLTFENLREWAGEKIYQRGEEYVDRVSQLSRTSDGAVAAWVAGTDDYATMVSRNEQGNLEAFCTCPYSGYGPCKHVVAVLLVVADCIKQQRGLPLLEPEDDLYLELWDDEDEDFDEEDFEDIDRQQAARHSAAEKLMSILAGKGRDELQQLLVSLTLDFPEVARRIRETEQLTKGKIGTIVRALRKEIRDLTAKDAWYNPWQNIGNLPDYDHVKQQLRALVAEGHGDEVLELGEELWRRGMEQVAVSDDEGETSMAISACMGVVLEALPRSGLALSDQLLWLIDRELEDEYNMWPAKGDIFDDPEDFFESPSENTFTELRQAAERVEIWPVVRKAALAYLQTGQRPDFKNGNTGDWPLGETEIKAEPSLKRFRHHGFPDWDMLLQIALLEQRFAYAATIYLEAPQKASWSRGTDERLAEAVAASHPDLSIRIWKSIADDQIDQVKPSAYKDSAKYLRRIRTVYENSGREGDWRELVKELRTKHNRKRRLMEVLDRLEANQRLID